MKETYLITYGKFLTEDSKIKYSKIHYFYTAEDNATIEEVEKEFLENRKETYILSKEIEDKNLFAIIEEKILLKTFTNKTYNETWKDLLEFPGYKVSTLGRFKNSKGRILNPRKNINKSHYEIRLSLNGKKINKCISVLIYKTFFHDFDSFRNEVFHKNGKKNVFHIDNLLLKSKSQMCLKRLKAKQEENPLMLNYFTNKKLLVDNKFYFSIGELERKNKQKFQTIKNSKEVIML